MNQENIVNFLAKQSIEEFIEEGYEEMINNPELFQENITDKALHTQKATPPTYSEELPF